MSVEKLFLRNDVFIPQIISLINEGKTVTIKARGYSMRPFIEHERDDLVFGQFADVQVGDVVLAEITKGVYVCHRVEVIDGTHVTLRGDGNVKGTEHCSLSDVRAKLLYVKRKGRTWNLTTSRFWRLYSKVWPTLLPIRRYLLALNKIIFLHTIPDRLKIWK